MATSLEKLIEMAERLNLKGKEVQEFVKTQQKLEIESKEAERKALEDAKKLELELEKEKTVREEKARQAAEKVEQQRVTFEKEIDKERFEREQTLRSEERTQELARMKHVMEMRKLEVASQSNNDSNQSDSHNGSRTESRGSRIRMPKLPVLGLSDRVDAYLARFEQYAELSEWPKDLWAIQLSYLLNNKALEVYHRLTLEGSVDYEVLKKTLLKFFDYTETGFKKKFKEARIENTETT